MYFKILMFEIGAKHHDNHRAKKNIYIYIYSLLCVMNIELNHKSELNYGQKPHNFFLLI